MHREVKIKQFPIVTTHWWPKTRKERFVWENEQYLYRFLPLVHNHVQVIWVRTHIQCVTCVCARSGSRCIHTGRRRQRLTEGVSEACALRSLGHGCVQEVKNDKNTVYCLKIKLNPAALTLRAPARSFSDLPDSQRNLKYSDTFKTKILSCPFEVRR